MAISKIRPNKKPHSITAHNLSLQIWPPPTSLPPLRSAGFHPPHRGLIGFSPEKSRTAAAEFRRLSGGGGWWWGTGRRRRGRARTSWLWATPSPRRRPRASSNPSSRASPGTKRRLIFCSRICGLGAVFFPFLLFGFAFLHWKFLIFFFLVVGSIFCLVSDFLCLAGKWGMFDGRECWDSVVCLFFPDCLSTYGGCVL